MFRVTPAKTSPSRSFNVDGMTSSIGFFSLATQALARLVDEQAAIYIDSFLDLSVAREVARKIIARLPDGPPGQDLVAGDMCMSQRTLQRKLKDEGTSFSDLLQDSRMQLSKRYLRQPGRSVVETSYLLGFAEPSAFSRAFKRWTGQTPAQYRDAKG